MALLTPSIVEIPLTRGQVALVSAVDYPALCKYMWVAQFNTHSGKWYASTTIRTDAGRKKLYMHRLITQCPPHLVVDHQDGDGLHCWRENLRVATHTQNAQNHRPHGDNPYRGVCLDGNTYRARIKGRHLGNFERQEDAAFAYDEAALEEYGAFAYLNFPELRPARARTPELSEIPLFEGCL